MADTPVGPPNLPEVERWKTRSFWIAVVTVLLAVVDSLGSLTGHPIVIPEFVYAMLTGFGVYTARVGNAPVK